MKIAACLSLVVVLAACAQPPEAIAPAYVSPAVYQNMSCSQLGAEAARVNAAVARVYDQQRKARDNDTAGVILLGLPTASLSGQNVSEQVAQLKGQQQTLEQVMIAKRCLRR